jgi:hypothetical protein
MQAVNGYGMRAVRGNSAREVGIPSVVGHYDPLISRYIDGRTRYHVTARNVHSHFWHPRHDSRLVRIDNDCSTQPDYTFYFVECS